MQDLCIPQPFPSPTPPLSASPFRTLTHRRDLSDELDVFQASSYLSGFDNTPVGFTKPPLRVQEKPLSCSREVVLQQHSQHQPHPHIARNQIINSMNTTTATNTSKKPVSSGGSRLARFLASLFHHHGSSYGKKEREAKSVKSDDEEHSSGGTDGRHKRRRRQRRSSASHFHRKASVSSEPVGSSRDFPTTDLPEPRSGSCADVSPVPLMERYWERSKRVHVRELIERGLELWDVNEDHVEKRWTLNKGGGGMVVVTEEMVEGAVRPKGRRGHLWRREEVEDDPWGGGGGGREESDDDDSRCDLLELPVFDGTTSSVYGKVKL